MLCRLGKRCGNELESLCFLFTIANALCQTVSKYATRDDSHFCCSDSAAMSIGVSEGHTTTWYSTSTHHHDETRLPVSQDSTMLQQCHTR